MHRTLALVAALAPLALAGCTDAAKAPAQAALQAADAALGRLTAEVDRYAPEPASAARAAGQAARAAAAEGAWRRALASATGVPGLVDQAVAAAAARHGELDRSWAEATRDLPNLVYAIEDRLDDLAEAGGPARGPDRTALAAARTELAAIRAGWDGVPRAVEAGDLEGGVASARQLRDRATALLWRVGLR
jgi:hypothetical protein